MRLVFLDTGPLGLLTNTRANPKAAQCGQWARGLLSAGVRVFVPEIADYEQRRKLLHTKATAGVRRLDRLKTDFEYAPITTDVMMRAAELWAAVRSVGRPTAPPARAGRGLHPGRASVAGRRSWRRGHRGHGQHRAPRPVRSCPDLGDDHRLTVMGGADFATAVCPLDGLHARARIARIGNFFSGGRPGSQWQA